MRSSLTSDCSAGKPSIDERQAARRCETARAFVQEAAIGQRADDEAFEIARGCRLHARGDFFGEEFEEELGHRLARHPAHAGAQRHALRAFDPGLGAFLRQRADAADIGLAFGDADDAARVEQIERVAGA